MKKIIRPIITVLLLTASASCSKYLDQTEFYELLQETSENLVIGEKLTNPYAISVMREALERMREAGMNVPKTIEPNCLYVRFDIKDSLQYSTLEKKGLELYTYPLDYEINSEGTESALTADNQQPRWIYTTVPVNFNFSSAPFCELLDSCYVPGCFPSTKGLDNMLDDILEETAITVSGNDDGALTKSGATIMPHGKLSVEYPSNNSIEPLKGVRVRSRYFLKSATAYTDSKGCYKIGTEFKRAPKMTVEFKNSKGFVVWDGLWVLSPAKMNIGKWSETNKYILITDKNAKWPFCILNNTVSDYYNYCLAENIPPPPANFKIMMIEGGKNENGGGCAPMLRRLPVVYLKSETKALDVLADIALVPVTTMSLILFKWGMPDMIMRAGFMKEGISKELKYNIWHELSHVSHWRVAGNEFWCDYVSAIFTHGCDYGTSKARHSELIDLGESCALAMENYLYYINNGRGVRYNSVDKFEDGIKFNYFFTSRILEDEIVTPSQMIKALGPKVRSIEDLKNALTTKYPDKKKDIEQIWKQEYENRIDTKRL